MLALLTAVMLAAGSVSAQTAAAPMARPDGTAQDRPNMTPEQRADFQTQRLIKQLSLSTEQTPKVRAIALAQAQEMQNLRTKYATADTRQGMGQELKSAQEKTDAQLKDVLTADQYTRYTQLRENRMDKHQNKRGSKLKVKS
ncbi:hypothetical protein [Hymenobacter perfusus]|uniref:DUF4890 domain-containing protein n=1 Tax=Hymenobacter perfusus TaxID=1236770 RepID=A0A3R9MC29_9BACT|nr:hypothetical protein [Hymenobacter perfusus]RSK42271.1 hypothetical protein EI293_15220 [Hymenobacter perfusus]